ncbi:endo-1,4-beta-xylanase [Roseateles asaccharophilus]|uniref:Beta-xylanase n=1 Tax=Roseateles asaccharophilus TaxID=582607 RepID=A0ABU2A595_9BURK|nr:endo-1,4-beta-xylanase [Roseateles asaccharophilus]MDR7331233.1 endo-1,4-beta-xylanase [Roseateles asaccharophilus]
MKMSPSRRTALQALALAAGGVALPGFANPAGSEPTLDQLARGPSLDALARMKGLRFGSTLGSLGRASRFHDTAYRELTGRECSVLVAENETKWPQMRPDPNKPYDFRAADEMFAWAKSRGMALRGHTLLWLEAKWLPGWLNALNYGSGDGEAARRMLDDHIRTTCSHFGDSIESWDVVNEAIAPETGELRRNVFSAPIGGVEQIDLAFRLARQHAPKAQLVYNDYMSWGGGNNARHRTGVLKLLTELKRRGTPVQALGIQGHIGANPSEAPAQRTAEWRRWLDDVMALDLDLLITEFDVNDKGLPADFSQRDAIVAAAARDWLDVTLAVPRLNRFLCWGLGDKYSWLHDFDPREDKLPKRPLPYDDQLRAKPLRTAIADALRAMPAR